MAQASGALGDSLAVRLVAFLLLPSIGWHRPSIEPETFSTLTGAAGAHSMFGTGDCGGHHCKGEFHGAHDEFWP